MKRILILAIAAIMNYGPTAWAVPQQINYQGYLTRTDGSPLDTTVSMTFKLYTDSTAGTLLWTETWPNISITDGLFSTRLGQVTMLTDAILNQAQLWLGITVGNNTEMTPRTRLVSVGYSYRVGTVDGASGGIISGNVNIAGKLNAGLSNTNNGEYAFVFGQFNDASGSASTISGGVSNGIDSQFGTIGGGYWSSVGSPFGTIGGGDHNTVIGPYAVISGGEHNFALGERGSIGGGQDNVVGTGTTYATVCGGSNNFAGGNSGTVGGGTFNKARGQYSVVAGGGGIEADSNSASGDYSVIGGGNRNSATQTDATIGGGFFNTASAVNATVGGGVGNNATAISATVAGGANNTASGLAASMGGGTLNTASGDYSAVSGGQHSKARGQFAVVAGGGASTQADSNSAIGGYSFVGGGSANSALGGYSVTSGGYHCIARGLMSVVGGGGGWAAVDSNSANGNYSCVPGGNRNTAAGHYSFAAGKNARALHDGSFVWSDWNGNTDFGSSAANQFNLRASGGYRLYSNAALTSGVTMAAGASGWTNVSDSTLKRNRRNVDTKLILEKVNMLPIQQWSYEAQDPSIEHIGPMAQDFWSLFHLGDDSLGINEIDPSGIALAAIQELKKENDELKIRLAKLEALLSASPSDNTAMKER